LPLAYLEAFMPGPQTTPHSPRNCRFATPTLYLPLPHWLDAWDSPWSCSRVDAPRLIESTTECVDCPNWKERAEAGIGWTIAQVGL
jgi:hypothetical protein